MVINGSWKNQPVAISVKPNCLTVSFEGGPQTLVFSFDGAGRLWTALVDGVSYRRGLDGKMIAKWQTASGERARRWVFSEEALTIENRGRGLIERLYAAICTQEARLSELLSPQGRFAFEQAIAFDEACSRADAARYPQVYLPVGILPPDQYMAVVLQATEGCAFNTCTFCDFYKQRPFRIKHPDEFRSHARAVRNYLGEGLSLRRTIFLGDANALVVPMPRLAELIEIVHQEYDVAALGGIYAFLDGFSAEKKTARDYRRLADRGLERVYIGMESGNKALLDFLHKPGKPEDVVRAVQAMKAGGVAVGVIVLLGAGGWAYAKGHVKDTIRAINAMGLDMNDIVYFSELVVDEGLPYVRDAYQAHLQPLSARERVEQGEVIEQGLRFSRRGGVPHISRYDIREFVY